MDKQKVKNMLSHEVISQIKDPTTRYIIQDLAFGNDNDVIDWNRIYKTIMTFMPELSKYNGYSEENMK